METVWLLRERKAGRARLSVRDVNYTRKNLQSRELRRRWRVRSNKVIDSWGQECVCVCEREREREREQNRGARTSMTMTNDSENLFQSTVLTRARTFIAKRNMKTYNLVWTLVSVHPNIIFSFKSLSNVLFCSKFSFGFSNRIFSWKFRSNT